jgi:hypothetical protein
LALVVVATLLAGLAVWRSPTAAVVSLKLALDRRDLSAVAAALDYHAITDAALAQLVEGRPEEPVDIRLVPPGRERMDPRRVLGTSVPPRALEREVERLVEEPEHALDVSWRTCGGRSRRSVRSGSVARFRVPRAPGRRSTSSACVRAAAVAHRRGRPRRGAVLLGPAPPEPQPASAESADEEPNEPVIEAAGGRRRCRRHARSHRGRSPERAPAAAAAAARQAVALRAQAR